MSSAQISVFGQRKRVDPFNLQLEDLNFVAIAHSLAQLNRYTGHAKFPYSVAQHTVLLVDFVPHKLKRAAMLHEWSETFTNDLSYPMKQQLPEFLAMEDTMQERIFKLMEEPIQNLHDFVEYDRRICRDEMETLFPHFDPEWFKLEGLGVNIEQWDWDEAKFEMLKTIREYV